MDAMTAIRVSMHAHTYISTKKQRINHKRNTIDLVKIKQKYHKK
jgi:hypothetical protein